MALVESRILSNVHRGSSSQEPHQHAAGENLGRYDRVRYPQPAGHVLETHSHPTYARVAAYKFIAVELDLVPVSRI